MDCGRGIKTMFEVLRIPFLLTFLLVGVLSALIVSAARSDFLFRGCGEIPRSEWSFTANCADAWFAQMVFAVSVFLCVIGTVLIWRSMHRA